MHVKFYAEVDREKTDRWQVIAEQDSTYTLLANGLTKLDASKVIRVAEKTARICGATVIA